MQIQVSDKNEIIGYAIPGGFVGGIEVPEVPAGFMENYAPGKYLFVNGEITENPSYTPPSGGGTEAEAEDAKISLGLLPAPLSLNDYKYMACTNGYLTNISMFKPGMSTLEFLEAIPNFVHFTAIGNSDGNFSDAPGRYCMYEFIKGNSSYKAIWGYAGNLYYFNHDTGKWGKIAVSAL